MSPDNTQHTLRIVRGSDEDPAEPVLLDDALLDDADVDEGRSLTGDGPVKLSIAMPAYNEVRTIESAIEGIVAVADHLPTDMELIVVDDGSTDGTAEVLDAHSSPRVVIEHHPTNLGKGAALQTAAAVASGSHFIPFDADLEYAPADLGLLLEPILEGRCDVVYGTRLFGVNTRYQSMRHAMGNRATTLAANLLFDAYLSDMHTCLKLIPLELFRLLKLTENGFGLDSEITAKLLKLGIRPFEVPVSYHSRSIAHGKKLGSMHGFECLRVMLRVRMADRRTVVREVPERRARSRRFTRRDGREDAREGVTRRSAAG